MYPQVSNKSVDSVLYCDILSIPEYLALRAPRTYPGKRMKNSLLLGYIQLVLLGGINSVMQFELESH